MSLNSHNPVWKISDKPVYKLTLLWAFAESGLGGFLHGFKIPITGFILGAFSIIIITLIAQLSEAVFKDLVKATLFVLAVKFAVSPHSPLPAYVAVCFQGFLGAIVFKIWRPSVAVMLIFAMVVMVESAIQKPLVATLLFGKELWLGFDAMMKQILQFFSVKIEQSLLPSILIFYVIIYTIWGAVVGFWCFHLPKRLSNLHIDFSKTEQIVARKNVDNKKSKLNLWNLCILCILMLSLFIFIMEMESAWIYLLRTTLIILIVYFIIVPVAKKLLLRFSSYNQAEIDDYYQKLPKLKWHVEVARKLSSQKSSGLKSYLLFIEILIWLSLMHDDVEK